MKNGNFKKFSNDKFNDVLTKKKFNYNYYFQLVLSSIKF